MKMAFTQFRAFHNKLWCFCACVCVCSCVQTASLPISLTEEQYLVKTKFPLILKPPYSPDLTTCDVCFILRFKTGLKGPCFVPVQDFWNNVTEVSQLYQKRSCRYTSSNDRNDRPSTQVQSDSTARVTKYYTLCLSSSNFDPPTNFQNWGLCDFWT